MWGGKKKMQQRISTQHASSRVLTPPNHSHHEHKQINKQTKKKRGKEVFLNLQMKKHTAEDQGVGYQWAASEHITIKGARELAGSQWSSRIIMGVQREHRREAESGRKYLNLTTFHQCAVQLFPGLLSISTGLECHKAKTLRDAAEVDQVGGERRDRHQALKTVLRLCYAFNIVLNASRLQRNAMLSGNCCHQRGSTAVQRIKCLHLPLNPSHWKLSLHPESFQIAANKFERRN